MDLIVDPVDLGMAFLTSKREGILLSHALIIADTPEAREEFFRDTSWPFWPPMQHEIPPPHFSAKGGGGIPPKLTAEG